jgi:hypothetical protein
MKIYIHKKRGEISVFIHYTGNGKTDAFLRCKEPVKTTTSKDTYTILTNYLKSVSLS